MRMKDSPVLAFWPELEELNLEAERRTAEHSATSEAEHPPRELCSNLTVTRREGNDCFPARRRDLLYVCLVVSLQNLRHYLWVKFHSEYRGFPLDKRFAQLFRMMSTTWVALRDRTNRISFTAPAYCEQWMGSIHLSGYLPYFSISCCVTHDQMGWKVASLLHKFQRQRKEYF